MNGCGLDIGILNYSPKSGVEILTALISQSDPKCCVRTRVFHLNSSKNVMSILTRSIDAESLTSM